MVLDRCWSRKLGILHVKLRGTRLINVKDVPSSFLSVIWTWKLGLDIAAGSIQTAEILFGCTGAYAYQWSNNIVGMSMSDINSFDRLWYSTDRTGRGFLQFFFLMLYCRFFRPKSFWQFNPRVWNCRHTKVILW